MDAARAAAAPVYAALGLAPPPPGALPVLPLTLLASVACVLLAWLWRRARPPLAGGDEAEPLVAGDDAPGKALRHEPGHFGEPPPVRAPGQLCQS